MPTDEQTMRNRIQTLANWIADDYQVDDDLKYNIGLVLQAIEAQGWVIDTTLRTAELAGERDRERGVTEHHDGVSPLTMIGRPPKVVHESWRVGPD